MSESISNRVKFLYSQYQQQSNTPTTKQIDFIHKMGAEVKENSSSFDAQKQIKFLIGSQKITPKQQKLLNMIPKETIDCILHRNVVIEDITRFELSRVLNILQDRQLLAPKVYNHPIITCNDYEYGWQESDKCPDGKLYYLVFYDLLMIDIDGELDLITLTTKLTLLQFTARLYRTYNGYHLFITSTPIDHKLKTTTKLMKFLGSDLFYTTFSFLNGFKVRLNPKCRDDELIAAEYIGTIGDELENDKLLSLLVIHDKYIIHHKK